MKTKEEIKFAFIGFFVLFFSFAFVFPVIPPRVSSSLNDIAYRYAYLLKPQNAHPVRIIGIAVDDYSLNRIQQRWPWKRSLYGRLLEILDKEGVNTVGIDFVFVGASEDPDGDTAFRESLDKTSVKVVLGYQFDVKKKVPVMPLPLFRDAAEAVGVINTPSDKDDKVRRIRIYLEDGEGKRYYSFPLLLASTYLNRPVQEISRVLPAQAERLLSMQPFLKERTFLTRYQVKPSDIIHLSFYEVLENLDQLKQQYGKDFLVNSFVLIYPEAEIHHDIYATPLGDMPGGFLHVNGVADIIAGRFLQDNPWLAFPFMIVSGIALYFILRYCGFLTSVIFLLCILVANLWGAVLLHMNGLALDYSSIVVFSFLYFFAGCLYKYAYFWMQLARIKDKATIDPLRGFFTLRYFYYRLNLIEVKKIYFMKDLHLVLIRLEGLKQELDNMTFEQVKNIWKELCQALNYKSGFWSVYSGEEIIGGLVISREKRDNFLHALGNKLGALLKERSLSVKVKVGCSRVKKDYPTKEIIFYLSKELAKDQEVVVLNDADVSKVLHVAALGEKESEKILDSLDEDIEEKNRHLLTLFDSLNKEHTKTKEAFFQIINSLVKALEARDPYTEGHSERVAKYALKLATALGWNNEEKDKLLKAALLHDLGKIGIPDSILHKKDRLTDDEFDFIRKHEIIAVKILEPLKDFVEILPWIMYHHERWDGKGYPHGLAGNSIPLASQLLSLADVYDALATGRDYKVALSHDDSLKEIVKNKGAQFNPELVDLFLKVMIEK